VSYMPVLVMGALPITLLVLGVPMFVILLTTAIAALVTFMHVPAQMLPQIMLGSVDNFVLLAVPGFLFAGELMGRGSVARRLVDLVQEGVGGVRGSLGVTAVGTSCIFGAISGASAACVATVGKIMLPAMRRGGYPDHFSAGLITAVGAIDIIIPPSIPMIVYGAAASESVARLYAAGVVPGLLIASIIAAYVVWFAHRNNIPVGEVFRLKRFLPAVWRGGWALGAPAIILGGIYSGAFSPTEAAAVACVYSIAVSRFIYAELSWRDIFEVAGTTAKLTAQILIIVASANVFSWLLTVNQVPATLVQMIDSWHLSKWTILMVLNIALLIVGCVIDPLSAILVLTPLLVPIIKQAGIDPVHFGIVFTVNIAIGLFHPPFGINIFTAQAALKLPLATIYRGIMPFIGLYLVALALITYIPEISLIGTRWVFN